MTIYKILENFYEEHYMKTAIQTYVMAYLSSKMVKKQYENALNKNVEHEYNNYSNCECPLCLNKNKGYCVRLKCHCKGGFVCHSKCWTDCVTKTGSFLCPVCRMDMSLPQGEDEQNKQLYSIDIKNMIPTVIPKDEFIDGIKNSIDQDTDIADIMDRWETSKNIICTNQAMQEPFNDVINNIDDRLDTI